MLQQTSFSKADNAPWVDDRTSQGPYGVESRTGSVPLRRVVAYIGRNILVPNGRLYHKIESNGRPSDGGKVCNDDLTGCAARPLAAPLTVDTVGLS